MIVLLSFLGTIGWPATTGGHVSVDVNEAILVRVASVEELRSVKARVKALATQAALNALATAPEIEVLPDGRMVYAHNAYTPVVDIHHSVAQIDESSLSPELLTEVADWGATMKADAELAASAATPVLPVEESAPPAA